MTLGKETAEYSVPSMAALLSFRTEDLRRIGTFYLRGYRSDSIAGAGIFDYFPPQELLARGIRAKPDIGTVIAPRGSFDCSLGCLVRRGAAGSSAFDVTWFGADTTGRRDSTPAFQAAIAAAETGHGVFVPCPDTGKMYLISGHVLFPFTSKGVVLQGPTSRCSSFRAYMIDYEPITDGAAFQSGDTTRILTENRVLYVSGFENLSIFSRDTKHSKIGFLLSDVSNTHLENLEVANFHGGANGSVGVEVMGRELVDLHNFHIVADRPIVLAPNPHTSRAVLEDIDLFSISFGSLTAADRYSVIDCDGANISGLNIHDLDLSHGGHGFYWRASAPLDNYGLVIGPNVRTEHGPCYGQPTCESYAAYIEGDGGAILANATINDTYLDGTRAGIFASGVRYLTVQDTIFATDRFATISATAPDDRSHIVLRNVSVEPGASSRLAGYAVLGEDRTRSERFSLPANGEFVDSRATPVNR